MHIKFEKKILRDKMKLKLQCWSKNEKNLPLIFEDSIINSALKIFPKDSIIGSFIPMNEEPSVLSFAQKNTDFRWAFPRLLNQSKAMEFLEVPNGILHVPEQWQQKNSEYSALLEPIISVCTPVSFQNIAAVFIPGLAFDKTGHRLGRGAGYYDRFLSENLHIKKIGICQSFQVVDELPTEAHDQLMDYLITEVGFQSFI